MKREKLKFHVRQSFAKALKRFNESGDCESLLSEGSSNEPTISHRLAYYIEAELRKVHVVVDSGPYCVDCEYSRHGLDEKQMFANEHESPIIEAARRKWKRSGTESESPFTIRPDILVHKRRDKFDNNLLIVEVKKQTNAVQDAFDLLKLKKATSNHGYQYDYGVQVIGDISVSGQRKLRVTTVLVNGEPIDPWT